jgi:phosphoglycerol transferase MdoB-like AlkP superfamily enzyme
MINRLKLAALSFIQIALAWLVVLLLIRFYEVLLNGLSHEFPSGLPGFLFWSVVADVVFWLRWLFLEYIIFSLLALVSLKFSKIAFKVFVVIMSIIHVGLIQYFHTSLVPLGADLYGYSIEDIKQTVGASGGMNIQLVVSFIFLLAMVIAGLKLVPHKIKPPLWLTLMLPGLSFIFLVSGLLELMHGKPYKSEFANNLALNKTDYFFLSSSHHFNTGDDAVDIYADDYIGDYGDSKSVRSAFKYIGGDDYPFFREDDEQDVLTPFFKVANTKPNIVIVLVEGLGRSFSNDGASLGNFTPFLDSLAGKSLYWKNFLSVGGRTFAVLPSLMGSLPFSKNGILELGDNMPPHASLYSLLKFNGYNTTFYYGGDSAFDNMGLFLKKNNVDEINDFKSFPKGYMKLPAANGFSWGYDDKALFRHYFKTRTNSEAKTPELNVILTVATHNPFLINDQAKYIKRFENRMDELGFEDRKKSAYRHYKLQYSSIMYVDDVLRDFFNVYKKRNDFANTIFLITGDHRMPEIPMDTKISRYHVPLIIYSPLLKRTAQFASISTHFDITPSLLAYLKSTYALNAPNKVSWLGAGLDTTRTFRNTHKYPIIQTKTDIVDFIMGEYHLSGTSLYKMNPDLDEELVQDPVIYNQVKKEFDNFKRRNAGIGNGVGILPDSILSKYSLSRK